MIGPAIVPYGIISLMDGRWQCQLAIWGASKPRKTTIC